MAGLPKPQAVEATRPYFLGAEMKKMNQKYGSLKTKEKRPFYFSKLVTTFKKSLLSNKRAQSALEYFVLFATVTLLTFISLSHFFTNDRLKENVGTAFFVTCVDELVVEE